MAKSIYDVVAQFAQKHPTALASLAGAGVGGLTGALTSEEGEEHKGAIGGAALGAGGGALAGSIGLNARKLMEALTPSPEKALLTGGIAGGAYAGYHGRAGLPAWVKKRLMTQSDLAGESARDEDMNQLGLDKGASHMSDIKNDASSARENLTKQAELEKMAAEKIAAFDCGMDIYCDEKGINKEALAKAHGINDVTELAPRTIAWLNSQTSETK